MQNNLNIYIFNLTKLHKFFIIIIKYKMNTSKIYE